MKKRLFILALITLCTALEFTILGKEKGNHAAETKTILPGEYNGIKIGADGRLIPSAYDKVKTFENGKKPLKEVFVAPNGDDVKGNGTMKAPYKTILKGMEVIQPGTAVRIMPGEYHEQIARNDLYGTEEHPIWIGGMPGMERPKMVVDNAFMNISGGGYVILHDMEVMQTPPYRAGRHGFNISSGGQIYTTPGDPSTINLDSFYDPEDTHHFVFRNLYVHHIGDSPIKTAGVNCYWLFDCEIAYGQQGLRGSGSIDNVGSHNATVAYNYLHNLIGHAIVFKGGSSNIDICNNLLVDYGYRGVQMGQSTDKVVFRPPLHLLPANERYEAKNIRTYSNIFIGGGYEINGSYDASSAFAFASSINCYAVNNTVINPTGQLFRITNHEKTDEPSYPNAPRLTDNGAACCGVVANNIFYYGKLRAEAIDVVVDSKPETFIVRNNLFYNTEDSNDKPNFGKLREENSIFFSDPLFEDVSNNNFNLKANSKAIGAGIDIEFVKYDYRGKPFENPRSLGAFQY